MNAQQLKNSILQMAVSGKLVPQDPNDEPASVLLERNRKEKEKLIKEGKIKKEKNPSYIFRGSDNTPYEKVGKNEPVSIANEVPFEIPERWEWVRVKTVARVLGGKRIPAGRKLTTDDTGHIYIRVSDMKDQGINTSALLYVPDDIFPSISKYIINKEDLYITVAGTIGKVGKIPPELDGANLTENADRLVFSHLDQDWFMQCLSSPLVKEQITSATTKVGQPKLAIIRIEEFLIPLPPIEEQKRIAKRVRQLEPYIAKYSSVKNQLNLLNNSFPEQLKKSILQLAVQGKLLPQDPADEPASALLERIRTEKERLIAAGKIKRDKNESVIFRRDNSHYEKLGKNEVCIDEEIPFDLPDSWRWSRLGNLIHLLSGQDFDPSGYNSVVCGIPYITGASNIEDGNVIINRWTDNPKNIAHSGELLVVCKGAGVGKMAVLKEESVHIARQIMAITPISTNLHYLQIVLEYNLEYLRRRMQGVIPGISRSDVLNLLCPVPPLIEQERIAQQVGVILPMVKSL